MNDEPCVCDTDFTCMADEHDEPAHESPCWAPCGGPLHTGNESHPPADICTQCEPRPCETCGGTEHPDALCRCWTDLTALPTADVKALLAADGWGVEADGRVTR